jgi:hypothetical protein
VSPSRGGAKGPLPNWISILVLLTAGWNGGQPLYNVEKIKISGEKKGKLIPSFAMHKKRWRMITEKKEKMDVEHSWLERIKHCKDSLPKIRNKFVQKWNCAALVRIPTFMLLCAIFIFPESICLFWCRDIGGPAVGKYKLLTDIHGCGNWDWGRAVSFLGVPKSDFLCSEEAMVEKRSGSRNNGWKQDRMKED